MTTTAAERFAARTVALSNGCIRYTNYAADGYGSLSVAGQKTPAHRFAWEQAFGPIPPGLEVHHRCANHACVNVDHLALLTQKGHRLFHRPRQERRVSDDARHELGRDHQLQLLGRRPCAHCGGFVLDGRRRTFCTSACRAAAYRRRKAGLPENALAGGDGHQGRLSLAEVYERRQLDQVLAELQAARIAAGEEPDWERLAL